MTGDSRTAAGTCNACAAGSFGADGAASCALHTACAGTTDGGTTTRAEVVATVSKEADNPSLLQLSQMFPVETASLKILITDALTFSNRLASFGNSFLTSSLPINNGSK